MNETDKIPTLKNKCMHIYMHAYMLLRKELQSEKIVQSQSLSILLSVTLAKREGYPKSFAQLLVLVN